MFTEICLLRGEDEPDGTSSHLGELLKRKAEEGVTVLLLIWILLTGTKLLMTKFRHENEASRLKM